MNNSKDLKDAESVRSSLSYVPSQPAFFPPYRDLAMISRQTFGTRMVYQETFLKIHLRFLLFHFIQEDAILGF